MKPYDNNGLLDIVIVNWNARSQLDACLESLSQQINSVIASVYIIDNSQDKTIESLNERFPFISLIKPKTNLGFGGGCNLGASKGTASFILFLNPDILFTEGSVEVLVQYLESGKLPEDIGIIGAQLLNSDGSVQKNIARLPRFVELFPRMIALDKIFPGVFPPHYQKKLDYESTQKVEQVPGAFFLVKRQVFDILNGFDQRFFMYYEDVDFSYRAHTAGFDTLYLPQVRITHSGGGTTETIKATRLFYVLRSKLLYVHKHFGKASMIILVFGIFSLELIGRIVNEILKLSSQKLIETIKAYIMLSKYLIKTHKK